MTRFSIEQISHGTINEWFEDALNRGDPRPTKEQYLKLADTLKILINRSDNRELRRAGQAPIGLLKDLDVQEELKAKIDAVVTAVKNLQDFAGDVLPTPGGDVLLDDLRDNLRKIRILYAPFTDKMRGAGRPREAWHEPALAFAEAVQNLLRDVGYRGGLSLKNPDSAPVAITSRAMSWVYNTSITPAAVANAARGRKRRKSAHRPASNLSAI